MDLPEIGRLVRARRAGLGLSQARLARLAGLSRATINQLETGVLADLGTAKLSTLLELLGLTLQATERRRAPGDALRVAARSASVSYGRAMDGEALAAALAQDEPPGEWLPHIASWLDETPLPLVVSSIEGAAVRLGEDPRRLWRRVERWAQALGSLRPAWA